MVEIPTTMTLLAQGDTSVTSPVELSRTLKSYSRDVAVVNLAGGTLPSPGTHRPVLEFASKDTLQKDAIEGGKSAIHLPELTDQRSIG